MCGIVGFTGVNNPKLLREMNNIQFHRGPDDSGYFECNDIDYVNLAMRRLSIIDITDGHQPMSNWDKSVWIVFNGEIFNASELREQLKEDGYKFKTDHSDTEVLIYMYEKYGKNMIPYLNGMFAFVIYDKKINILFAARDRFGIKPFYYSLEDKRFSFSSELKSLLLCPWISKSLNNQSIYNYFSFQSISAPSSIFKNIKKLPAAHFLEYNLIKKDFIL
jgi:asparagine synthase (glutamine-hydrolysing)